MKKILVVINRLGVGGAERLVVDDINEMLRRGVPVKLLTLQAEKRGNSLALQCAISPEDWRNICLKGFFDLRAWRELAGFMREYKPDMVVSHLWFANTISRIVCAWCGIKNHIAFEHNVDSVKTWKTVFADRLLQRFSVAIVAVSETVRRSLLRRGIEPKKVKVLFNAVDTARYAAGADEKLAKELNPEHVFVYLFVGRLIKQKAVDVLLEAFAKVGSGLLLLAGDGAERGRLEELAAALGIAERVRFLGIRHDVPALLALADCFVLPSRYEGLPMVLIEAIVSEKAIIISDFEAGEELIQNEKTGLVVPKEDPQALADAMLRIQKDEPLQRKLKSNLAEDAKKFSIKHHVDALLAVITP